MHIRAPVAAIDSHKILITWPKFITHEYSAIMCPYSTKKVQQYKHFPMSYISDKICSV